MKSLSTAITDEEIGRESGGKDGGTILSVCGYLFQSINDWYG